MASSAIPAAPAPAAPPPPAFANPLLAALPPPPRERFDLPTAIALAAASFEAYLEPRGAAWRLRKEQRWAPAGAPAQDNGSMSNQGGKLTFTDADFLRAAWAGVLELRILGARGLRAVNRLGGKSDPFCSAELPDGGGRVATHVVCDCLEPVWYSEAEAEAAANKHHAAAGGGGATRQQPQQQPQQPPAKAPACRSRTHSLYVRRDPSASAGDPAAGVRFAVYDRSRTGADVELGAAAVAVADLIGPGGGKAGAPGAWVKKTILMCGAQATGALEVEARYLPFSARRGAGVAFAGDYVADDGPAVPAPAPDEVRAAGAELVAAGRGEGGAAEAAVGDAAGLLGAAGKNPAGVLGRLGGLFGRGKGAGDAAAAAPAAAAPAAAAAPSAAAASAPSAAAAAVPAAAAAAATPAAAAAAQQREMADAWRAVTSAAGRILHVRGEGGKGKGHDYRAVAFVQSIATDTEAWVGRSLSAREIVIAFRGTEQTKIKDALSDLNAVPVPYLEGGKDKGAPFSSPSSLSPPAAGSNGKVYAHRGFLAAWQSVRDLVFSAVGAAIASAPASSGPPPSADAPWTVYVTGHSLGGALATLCTYELAGDDAPGDRTPELLPGLSPGAIEPCMYTYGAPRVGNVAFAVEFHRRTAARGRRSWRVANERDLVPSIPRLMGYAHVPYGVRLPASDAAAAAPAVAGGGNKDAKQARAQEEAARAIAGVFAEEQKRGGGAANATGGGDDGGAAADRAAAAALAELERFLVFEPATGRDALGEGLDATALASDAARSARAAFQARGFSLGAIGAAASAAAGAVGGGALVEQEMRLGRAIADGSGVGDHMEGAYFGKLVRALGAAGVRLPSAIADRYPSGGGGGAAADGGTGAAAALRPA